MSYAEADGAIGKVLPLCSNLRAANRFARKLKPCVRVDGASLACGNGQCDSQCFYAMGAEQFPDLWCRLVCRRCCRLETLEVAVGCVNASAEELVTRLSLHLLEVLGLGRTVLCALRGGLAVETSGSRGLLLRLGLLLVTALFVTALLATATAGGSNLLLELEIGRAHV